MKWNQKVIIAQDLERLPSKSPSIWLYKCLYLATCGHNIQEDFKDLDPTTFFWKILLLQILDSDPRVDITHCVAFSMYWFEFSKLLKNFLTYNIVNIYKCLSFLDIWFFKSEMSMQCISTYLELLTWIIEDGLWDFDN